MYSPVTMRPASIRRGRGACPLLLVLLLATAGCGHVWDDLTAVSPEGGFWNNAKYRVALLTDRTPPLEVLAYSKDGDMRARAYRKLEDPWRKGGSIEEQNKVLDLLATAATSEASTVARLAAVERLAQIDDPRAVKALTDAFYAPSNVADRNAVVRVAVIQAMAKHKDPSTVQTLVEAMTHDPARDVRLAAADALGEFQSSEATAALVRTLREEKDLALRHVANQSLQQITGRELPPDPDAWEAYLSNPSSPPPSVAQQERSWIDRVVWWK